MPLGEINNHQIIEAGKQMRRRLVQRVSRTGELGEFLMNQL